MELRGQRCVVSVFSRRLIKVKDTNLSWHTQIADLDPHVNGFAHFTTATAVDIRGLRVVHHLTVSENQHDADHRSCLSPSAKCKQRIRFYHWSGRLCYQPIQPKRIVVVSGRRFHSVWRKWLLNLSALLLNGLVSHMQFSDFLGLNAIYQWGLNTFSDTHSSSQVRFWWYLLNWMLTCPPNWTGTFHLSASCCLFPWQPLLELRCNGSWQQPWFSKHVIELCYEADDT